MTPRNSLVESLAFGVCLVWQRLTPGCRRHDEARLPFWGVGSPRSAWRRARFLQGVHGLDTLTAVVRRELGFLIRHHGLLQVGGFNSPLSQPSWAGGHRIPLYGHGMNVTAFLALERAGVEAGWARLDRAKHHPAAPAPQAAGVLDRQKMRRRQWLIFAHDAFLRRRDHSRILRHRKLPKPAVAR
jgi:hypothetical protein